MSRWLYNVEAIKTWAESGAGDKKIRQWTSDTTIPRNGGEFIGIRWWTPDTTVPRTLSVGEFIGQGRSLGYCNLTQATMEAFGSDTTAPEALEQRIQKVAAELHGRKRPGTWYVAAITAATIVWAAVISALAVDLTMSPYGLAGSYGVLGSQVYLLFGGYSSVSWAIQFCWEQRSRVAKWASHLSNALAVLALLMAVALHAVRFPSCPDLVCCWPECANSLAI